MPEDLVAIIEELIKTQKGDITRLQNILSAIKNEEPISFEDHQYVESLTPNPDVTVEEAKTNAIPDTSESTPSVPTSDETTNPARSPAKKYATIGIIIAVVLVAYVGLDIYAVNSLQFRPHHGQQVVISDTQLGIQSEVCNPSYFPATFTNYKIVAMYESKEIENATIQGVTLSPKSAAILNGIFSINKESSTQIANESLPFDPSKATIVTSVSAPIFGVIPYSVDIKYAAQDFQDRIKNPPPGTFDCYP
ncbi:MAG: hypothetical protein KGH95_06660 [Thaumarchaeota archaeon]|nr:hypothetical protein [Nitrososphaerota archaeon]